jgi:MFS family permease
MENIGRKLAFCGTIFQLGIILGILVTTVCMTKTLVTEKNQPEDMAAQVQIALLATSFGMSIAFVGVILILTALIGMKYREKWFYNALWKISILWLFFCPLGTILGIGVMFYLANHSKEFN